MQRISTKLLAKVWKGETLTDIEREQYAQYKFWYRRKVLEESYKGRPLADSIIPNIAPDHKDTTWGTLNRKDLPEPSVAESLIIDYLGEYDVEWYREVCFRGLQFKEYSYPRYDIYLPAINTIIEYDGTHHNTPEQVAMDRAKDKFCIDNGIVIIRYSKNHFYHLETHIEDLMTEHRISRKQSFEGTET